MKHLIFLPGASGNTAFWQPLIALLPSEYSTQIIAYPEFDHEPARAEVYDFNSLSRYVLDQIQQESVLIAQSMGGIFAVQAALAKPDLVQGLVLIATSGGLDLGAFEVEDWRDAYQQQFLNYPDWFTNTQLDYSAELGHIQQKTLLLWGDADPISPVAVGAFLHQQLNDSALQIIHGGDHLFAERQAEETAPWIQHYLQQLNVNAAEARLSE
ncbi:alpha/beta fold hydrolase [Acinetobacter sp.]|jgi:pimeloyl-ACP methyl ester carboxylesterase|uniref:alpha/beta fold hydrolase n=1 Tax=Acinetobacter sp. TaxID=472 RepID=UPI0035AD85C8